MFEARIHVTLKKSVLDPQGDTVRSALTSLGFQGVADCRIGKFMVVRLDERDQLLHPDRRLHPRRPLDSSGGSLAGRS